MTCAESACHAPVSTTTRLETLIWNSSCHCALQVGKRLTKVSMISGSIVRVWGALESVLVRSESILSKSDRTMRIVRVNTGEATSLIGAWRCLRPHEIVSPPISAYSSMLTSHANPCLKR